MGALSEKRIIVAVDGSETARDALKFALLPCLVCSVALRVMSATTKVVS